MGSTVARPGREHAHGTASVPSGFTTPRTSPHGECPRTTVGVTWSSAAHRPHTPGRCSPSNVWGALGQREETSSCKGNSPHASGTLPLNSTSLGLPTKDDVHAPAGGKARVPHHHNVFELSFESLRGAFVPVFKVTFCLRFGDSPESSEASEDDAGIWEGGWEAGGRAEKGKILKPGP